jgi:tetratricopeptide (TPR) repeat protein
VVPDQKISRVYEMQTVALIIGGLIMLAATFYAGTKARYFKGLFNSRNKPEIANVDTRKFPGLTAHELVEQALAVERLGQWREAVERLLVAKRRNTSYRGLVFHAAKLCYDNGDFDGADLLLERAVAFGEEVDTANYLRGLIASGRNDLVSAERLFHAAVEAEPFTPGYYYYLAEILRKQHRSGEAVGRYEQAANRTVNEQDALLCRFKARLARAETADAAKVQAEVAQKRNAGPLSLDWVLTDAALKIRGGELKEAAELIREARNIDQSGLPTLFASCTADMLFTEAANRHPQIAEVMRVGKTPDTPGPTLGQTP